VLPGVVKNHEPSEFTSVHCAPCSGVDDTETLSVVPWMIVAQPDNAKPATAMAAH
jgi:hypothetical protein